jgi:DNA topoisomerase VI subunit B
MPTYAIPLAEFDHEMATTRRLLERVPDDRGDWKPHPKSFPLGHLAELVSLFTTPRGTTVRQHLSHLSHHRGQLTVYLRELDVPLPQIYGPTADERW